MRQIFFLPLPHLRRSFIKYVEPNQYGIIILTINKTVMKRLNLYLSLLLAALIGVNFSSCSNDDGNETGGNGTGNDSTIIKVDTATVFISDSAVISAEEMFNKLYIAQGVDAADQDTLRKAFMAKIEARKQEVAKELKAKLGDTTNVSGISMGFKSYTYKYWSRGPLGNSILMSSIVSWAQYWFFGWHDLDPNNIYLMEHYTILSDAECPSYSHSKEQLTLGDNLLIMPDYIGYGFSKDKQHPYLNHEICAVNSVDALEAGYAVFQQKKGSGTKMEDDWKMYVLGASQGGGNALAVHKYLDTHLDVANKWRFEYSYCCAGPYCPRKTMDYYYDAESLSYPVILPIVIKSMLYCYPEILGKWKEEDFYSDKYLKVKPTMDQLLAAKENTSEELIAKLKELLGQEKISVKDMLSDSALNKNSAMTQALYECLDKNDLTTGWTPVHKINLYHSENDDIVPYSNAEAVANAFGDKVDLSKSYWVGHVKTCAKWYGILATNIW